MNGKSLGDDMYPWTLEWEMGFKKRLGLKALRFLQKMGRRQQGVMRRIQTRPSRAATAQLRTRRMRA